MSGKATYTPKEAAESLGVSDETIYRWLRSGLMSAARRGLVKARYLIPASEVERVRQEGNYGEPEGNKIGHYASA
jgi:excisionase family DNA binding protein